MTELTDQSLVAELVSDVLSARRRTRPNSSGVATHDGALWSQLEELGLTLPAVPESLGGAGGSIADQLTILRVAGAHGLTLPLLETGLIAGWLLAAAELPAEPGPMTFAPASPGDHVEARRGRGSATLVGVSHGIPAYGEAVRVVVAVSDDTGAPCLAVLTAAEIGSRATLNAVGEQRHQLTFRDSVATVTPVGDRHGALQVVRRAALGRCVMIVGALGATKELTVSYATHRQQFGKPLRRFQAIEHQLAILVRECALAEAATEAAVSSLLADRELTLAEVAAAKVVCTRAAERVAAIAHQVHGAIGVTREHELPHLTRCLLGWSGDFGSARVWARALGQALTNVDPWTTLSEAGDIRVPGHGSPQGH
jgi:acyl-CoA dehydrogenase